VAVTRDGRELPTLVLDAGTGLRSLTALLGGTAFDGSIVLSHLHWDHMQGLPFFAAGDNDSARVDLYLPAQEHRSGRDLLAQSLAPPSFPISPEGLRGKWAFHAIDDGRRDIDDFAVTAVDVEHKGGRTFGMRIDGDRRSLAYLPDHAPAAGMSDELMAMVDGVDVLVHDAQFLEHERPTAIDYGHATVKDAIGLAVACGAGTLVLFHHSPARTDAELDDIAACAQRMGGDLSLVVATEGLNFDVR
jgi:ribonuclease BN (tRNA processing enzyme)